MARKTAARRTTRKKAKAKKSAKRGRAKDMPTKSAASVKGGAQVDYFRPPASKIESSTLINPINPIKLP